MGIGLRVGNRYWEIGTADFLHAFFSTVSSRLEPAGWGSRFPVLMHEVYAGTLDAAQAGPALEELRGVRRELAKLPPTDLVWDVENLEARPPWGDNISSEITDLGNYFVTSDGRDLFEVMEDAISYLGRSGQEALRVQ